MVSVSLLFLSLLASVGMGSAMIPSAAAAGDCTCSSKAPAFFLAGDSTTAVQMITEESKGGGWGNGFLALLKSPAWGTNYGHNGATTASFVSMGDWGRVMANVKNNTDKFQCFVTIQVCFFAGICLRRRFNPNSSVTMTKSRQRTSRYLSTRPI
jgi:hypothetical protein